MKTGVEWKEKLKALEGEALIMDDRPDTVVEEADTYEQIMAERYLNAFGKRFASVTLDGFEAQVDGQQKAKVLCEKYVENLEEYHDKGVGLLFVGNVGTGKSHLAYAVMKEALKKNFTCEVKKFIEIAREIKDAWNTRTTTETEIIKRYSYWDFLLIEEIGVQYNTANEKVILYDIVEQRYIAQRPTILTSNLGPKELKEYLDFDGKQRVWSRLREVSLIKYFDWEDYRPQCKTT